MPVKVLVSDGVFDKTYHVHMGLSKREHFAGLAMQGLWASVKEDSYDNYEQIAKMAVCQADALIKELNNQP